MMDRWISFAVRHWLSVLALVVVVTGGALWSAKQLTLDGDLARLLPEEAQSAKNLAELERLYGAQVGRLTLVISAKGAEAEADAKLVEALEALGPKLEAIEGVARVELVDPVSELEPYRLLYMKYDDLEVIVERLKKRIRWERQRANPLFAGLKQEPPSVDFSEIEAKYERDGRTYYVGDRGERLVFVHPSFPASNLDRSRALTAAVRQVSAQTLSTRWPQLQVQLTGRYEKRVEQQALMTEDIGRASGVAFILLGVFLLIYFRSFVAVLQVLLPLLIGTIVSMGVARGIFGSLNILTGFLGAILMGLGVDYGIHLVGRYHELHRQHEDAVTALKLTFKTTGKANIYAGLTTMAALGSMMVSDFRAFKEFGIIAVLGISLILLSYFVILPVLVTLVDRGLGATRPSLAVALGSKLAGGLDGHQSRYRGMAILAACLLCVAAPLSLGLGELSMDETFDSLQITDTPTWALDQRVNEILGQSQTPAVILAKDQAHAVRVRAELERRKKEQPEGYSIDRVLGLEDLLPDRQQERRAMLSELAQQIDKVPERSRSEELRDFDKELRALLDKPTLTLKTLPKNLSTPFTRKDRDDASVLLVLPSVELSVAKHLRAFGAVTRDLPGPTDDAPKILATSDNQLLLDILRLVRRDLFWMVVLTLSGLVLITGVAFGLRRESLLLFGTLSLAIASAAGALGLMGQTINFINVLIIPIWLGLAVDASYHMLLQLREAPDEIEPIVTTALSVSAAFMTSMIGFGALIMSRHAGLASLARVALVGLSLILVVEVSVVVLMVAIRKMRSR